MQKKEVNHHFINIICDFVTAGWIFVMDGVMKICVQGWKSYWRLHVNRFDFVVTALIAATHVTSFFYDDVRYW